MGIDQADVLALSPTDAVGVWIDIGSMLGRPAMSCIQEGINIQPDNQSAAQRES